MQWGCFRAGMLPNVYAAGKGGGIKVKITGVNIWNETDGKNSGNAQ